MQDQPGLKTRNRDHIPTRFDAMNLVVISEFQNELPLESAFFEVNPLYRFVWNCDLCTSEILFWKMGITLNSF